MMNPPAYRNRVFASLDPDHALERIAGGSETDVYRTDDYRYVVKLKHHSEGTLNGALNLARNMHAAAAEFAACLGPEHSIPSYHFLARDSQGRVQVVTVQPYIRCARSLAEVDYYSLSDEEWQRLVAQLRAIMRRAVRCYQHTGHMPDLYGSFSGSMAERLRLNAPRMWPRRVWSFLTRQSLLRAHNLLLTDGPERRVILVDYDQARWDNAFGRFYYALCRLLYWRDRRLVLRAKFPRRARHSEAAP
jgi:hypothetical protein